MHRSLDPEENHYNTAIYFNVALTIEQWNCKVVNMAFDRKKGIIIAAATAAGVVILIIIIVIIAVSTGM